MEKSIVLFSLPPTKPTMGLKQLLTFTINLPHKYPKDKSTGYTKVSRAHKETIYPKGGEAMNDIAHKQATREAVSAKYRGGKRLLCKTQPIYPKGAEREFQRLTDAYMRILNETLKKHLPEIREAAKREREANARRDDISDLMSVIQRAFTTMGIELERKTSDFNLRRRIELMANMTRKLSIREWKKAVHATLGIDLVDDYYLGEFYREAMKVWVDKNVSLIKTIPGDSLRQMKDIVQEGFRTGKTTTAIVKEVQRTYGVDKRRARLIARDQIAKLNSDLTKTQQTDAGVSQYTWSTSGDSRVREGHQALNGKKFSWADPPVVDEKTGRRAHPGEDYQCRCVALPVFDIEDLNLPFSGKGGG